MVFYQSQYAMNSSQLTKIRDIVGNKVKSDRPIATNTLFQIYHVYHSIIKPLNKQEAA